MAEDPLEIVGITLDEKYRVDGFVEEGELRVTYRGHDTAGPEHSPVAIRCLNLPITLDDGLASRFVEGFHERARLHRRLGPEHASFVQVLATGTAPVPGANRAVHYEICEWLDATSLTAHFAKTHSAGKTLPLDEVLTLLGPVADGLAYLHSRGVTHGELNPKNILVVLAGGSPVLKIDDFGGGHVENEKGAAAPILRVLEPEYTAPEQIDKHLGALGPWTDVFSLAVLVLECMAGTLGTRSLAAGSIADTKHLPSAERLGLKLPPAVDRVLDRALSSDPHRRPADVATFWRELRAAAIPPLTTTDAAKPPPPPSSRPRPSGAAPPKRNPFVKATLVGIQPVKLPTTTPKPPTPPATPADDEALELLPSAVEEFTPDEAPTRRREATPEPAHAERSDSRAELPLGLFTTPPSLDEPEIFLPALTGPTLLIRARGAVVWVGEASVTGWTFTNKWVRTRAWPWIVDRARDGRPQARAAFAGSVLVGVVLLSTCVVVCVGGGSPKPAAVAASPPEPAVTPTTPLPHDIPPPPPVAPEPSVALELPSVAPSAAPAVPFTRASATAALEAAGSTLSECQGLGTLRGPGSIRVLFSKSGGVAKITIGPPYADTPEGACILDRFGRAQMGPIRGTPGTVNYTFTMPR